MSDEWLPPRKRRALDEPHFGEPTPPTASEHSREPALRDVPPDDETVRALISSTPPSDADPLPPLDDEFVSDVHLFDVANLDPSKVNAKLEQVARARPDDPPSQSERLFALELANSKLRLDVDNLTALVKDLMRRNAGV